MTAHQQKCLLSFLGYEGEQATAEFQAHYGLVSDGIFGPKTREKILQVICQPDGWSGIRHFTRGEFACKCGGICDGFPAEPEEKLVRIADGIREHFAAPAIVTSGVRCSMHNANVGGVVGSRHLLGKAMDFRIVGKSAGEILSYVNQLVGIRYAYAIDAQHVHIDIE
jgi:hypothetical protein